MNMCAAEGTIISKSARDAAQNRMYYAMLNFRPRFLDLLVSYIHIQCVRSFCST